EDHHSGLQHAWRMVIELVSGMAIGFGLGYGLDVLFGTLPIFMIVFTLLGFVAGVRTMLSTAREIQKDQVINRSEKSERNK
ncbi:MAG: AtpZ/AtpI family protein, partial [Paracoccaceae bacterium]